MDRPPLKTRRPGRTPGPLHLAGAAEVPGGFREFLVEFLGWMNVRGFSAHTLKNRRVAIGYFIDWCEARDVTRPAEVTRALASSAAAAA